MDIWDAYTKEEIKDTYGRTRLRLMTGNRWHTSLSMVQDRSTEIQMNGATFLKYVETKRYAIAKDITFEMLMTLYNVNNSTALVLRPSQTLKESEAGKIVELARKHRMENVELRLIGLQNNSGGLERIANALRKRIDFSLIEVDLFGNETRHIAIDLKTGSSYDLLLNNKIYAPAELINSKSVDEFNQKRSQLAFV